MSMRPLYASYNNFYGDIKIPHTTSAYTVHAHDTRTPNLKFTQCATYFTRDVPHEKSRHGSAVNNLNISLESVWRRTRGKSFSIFSFALLISNLIYAPEHKTFCLLYFHILPQVCQIIVWHTARVAGTAFHARMEFGAAKTSYYGARWQSEFWATAKAEEGELHFNKFLRA